MDMIKSYGYGIVMHTVRCREHIYNIEQHKLKTMDTYHGTVRPGVETQSGTITHGRCGSASARFLGPWCTVRCT